MAGIDDHSETDKPLGVDSSEQTETVRTIVPLGSDAESMIKREEHGKLHMEDMTLNPQLQGTI